MENHDICTAKLCPEFGVTTNRNSDVSQQLVHRTSGPTRVRRDSNVIAETRMPMGQMGSTGYMCGNLFGDLTCTIHCPPQCPSPSLSFLSLMIIAPTLFQICHTSNATRPMNALFSFSF
jgi:hypothetical protein